MLSLLCCACASTAPSNLRDDALTQQEREPQQKSTLQSTSPVGSDDLLLSGYLNGAPDEAKETWRIFTKDGRYRIARADDFRIPAWAMNAYGIDLNTRTRHPIVGGDLNHDGSFMDFAVIVIDTMQRDEKRFGLVVFNEPKRQKSAYTLHWVYQERDLSRTVLEQWSGGLALRTYREGGSYDYCYVNWDRRDRKYYCSVKYKL
jgi:hypothetical protein